MGGFVAAAHFRPKRPSRQFIWWFCPTLPLTKQAMSRRISTRDPIPSEEKKDCDAEALEGAFADVNVDELEFDSKPLSGGGFALVYRARWNGRYVAVKTLVRACLLCCVWGAAVRGRGESGGHCHSQRLSCVSPSAV